MELKLNEIISEQMRTIRMNVKYQRVLKQLTQKELANRSGCTVLTIFNLESKKNDKGCNIISLVQIAHCLEINLTTLLVKLDDEVYKNVLSNKYVKGKTNVDRL